MSEPLSKLPANPLPEDAVHLQNMVRQMQETIGRLEGTVRYITARYEKLSHEMAVLKRTTYGKKSERLGGNLVGEQAKLFEESVQEDIAGVELELAQLDEQRKQLDTSATSTAQSSPPAKSAPKRTPLPANLPRVKIYHEPSNTTCKCGCALRRMGEEITEKLDYAPGDFTVEQHIRGRWVCDECETFEQEPMPAYVIDKGSATPGLLAQVLVNKYADHLPHYRQEAIFSRAGLGISRSTLSMWTGQCGVALQPLADAMRELMIQQPVLHGDETPVPMLSPGKGSTHQAYFWVWGSTGFEEPNKPKLLVYEFAMGRAGKYASQFLQDFKGTLVCDDYQGYKHLFTEQYGITEAGCMAHARRKFFDLNKSAQSQIAHEALRIIGQLYGIEAEIKHLDARQRQDERERRSKPVCDALRQWLIDHLAQVPPGTKIANAIEYSLKRWTALTHFLKDGRVPIDNNHIENRIRPIAVGRSNWMFIGSERAGTRAAAVMSLIQSAKLNGHDPYLYMKDVLTRLPTTKQKDIELLLPHRWQPA